MFTTEIIQSAWKAARCWPIARSIQPPPPTPQASTISVTTAVSRINPSDVSDTPARLRTISQKVTKIVCDKLNDDDKGMVYKLIDLYAEKVTKYRDIDPRAETLNKLWSGKVRKSRKNTRHVGEARVLTHKYVNEGIKKAADVAAAKAERQRVAAQKKKLWNRKRLLRRLFIHNGK